MTDRLRLNTDNCTTKTCEIEGRSITYRAYEGLNYCESPLDPIQKMNIFVPEAYFREEAINGYTKDTAPIFFPNTVGGYMPGPADEPGIDRMHGNQPNSLFLALEHGYVAVSAGIRGRTSGRITREYFEGSNGENTGEATGKMVGRAPALIVDYKAAIRFLKYNKDLIAGDTEKIITNGTSAGGALSALAGASADQPEYEPYLKEIGAAEESDGIFAASCYCPIHNLENADAAYEWLFYGINDYHRMRMEMTEKGPRFLPDNGHMTDLQISLSETLKKMFPPYVNSLGLKNGEGVLLSLDEEGEGTFKEYVKEWVIRSADKELQTHDNEHNRRSLMTPGSEIEKQDYLTIKDGHIADLNWDRFVEKITRMKATPAFDSIDLSSPENEEFGDEHIEARHFTKFSLEHSLVPGAEMADQEKINLLNPLYFIRKREAGTTKNWRIRPGSFDRDTSLAIPVILAATLENRGYHVDFSLPWGLPHSGDYDLQDLFSWIDGLCKA